MFSLWLSVTVEEQLHEASMVGYGTQKQARGRMSYESGLAAEDRISANFEERGFTIEKRRWRGMSGEIDLIARNDKGLVFVEVKQSRSFEGALGHLNDRQIARLYLSVEEFLATEPDGALTEVRFDVALVNQHGEFKIIENAFA